MARLAYLVTSKVHSAMKLDEDQLFAIKATREPLGLADKAFLAFEGKKRKYRINDQASLIICDACIYLKFAYAGNVQYHKIDRCDIDTFLQYLSFSKQHESDGILD